jgi:serine/threonine-protein kinase
VLLGVGVLLAVLLLLALLARNTGEDATTAPPSRASASRTPSSTATSSAPASSAPPTTSAPSSSTPSAPSTSAAPVETVTIDENDYVGRDVTDAEKELKDLGLKVDRNELDNPGTAQENAVESVDPDGKLSKGATVTISYYGAPPVPESPSTGAPGNSSNSGNSHGKGKGR